MTIWTKIKPRRMRRGFIFYPAQASEINAFLLKAVLQTNESLSIHLRLSVCSYQQLIDSTTKQLTQTQKQP